MKLRTFGAARAILLAIGIALAWPGISSGAGKGQAVEPLPASLDKLYTANASGPAWLLAMFAMSGSFSGAVSDFMEGDFDNAQQRYDDFRNQYATLSLLVPEWKENLPTAAMDAMGVALKTKDPSKFMPAVEAASQVCLSCHVKNMARVQQKYHWGDFSGIGVTDPVSKRDMPFPIFMQMVESDLSGVQVDLMEGQVDKAREHGKGLAARYVALKETCDTCHDTARAYYVDAGVTGMITKLNTALESPKPDPKAVEGLLMGIGMESCHKCHLVHAPAALARIAETQAK